MTDYTRQAVEEYKSQVLSRLVANREISPETAEKLSGELEMILAGMLPGDMGGRVIEQGVIIIGDFEIVEHAITIYRGPVKEVYSINRDTSYGRILFEMLQNIGREYTREELLEIGQLVQLVPSELQRKVAQSDYFKFEMITNPARYRINHK